MGQGLPSSPFAQHRGREIYSTFLSPNSQSLKDERRGRGDTPMAVLPLTLGMGHQPGLWQCLGGSRECSWFPGPAGMREVRNRAWGVRARPGWSAHPKQLLSVPECATGQAGSGVRCEQQLNISAVLQKVWEVGSSLQALINTGGNREGTNTSQSTQNKKDVLIPIPYPGTGGHKAPSLCHTCGTA